MRRASCRRRGSDVGRRQERQRSIYAAKEGSYAPHTVAVTLSGSSRLDPPAFGVPVGVDRRDRRGGEARGTTARWRASTDGLEAAAAARTMLDDRLEISRTTRRDATARVARRVPRSGLAAHWRQ